MFNECKKRLDKIFKKIILNRNFPYIDKHIILLDKHID